MGFDEEGRATYAHPERFPLCVSTASRHLWLYTWPNCVVLYLLKLIYVVIILSLDITNTGITKFAM